jgi:hypothetical protein
MPTTIFDLLFLFVALLSLVVFVTVILFLVQKRRTLAMKIVGLYTIFILIYLLTGIVVSYAKPQRLIAIGDPWCFDDWCLTVLKATRATVSSEANYRIDFEISSRAQRVSQRAKYGWIYLLDEGGRQYSAEVDAANVSLDIQLGPGEIVTASRIFRVPANVITLYLVTGHGSPYCGVMSFLVIGESGCLFHKPTAIPILTN